jgi:SAM-dependent methyltransferase
MNSSIKWLVRPVWAPIRRKVEQVTSARTASLHDDLSHIQARVDSLEQGLAQARSEGASLRLRVNGLPSVFAPEPLLQQLPSDAPFMEYSTCNAHDFFHPKYAQICRLLSSTPHMHRKVWEWVFITYHLREAGVIKPKSTGLAFGVGKEPLPAVFASLGCSIIATDAPQELDSVGGWVSTNQYSSSVEQLRHDAIIAYDVLRRRVKHRACDMNNIDPSLHGFDFCWSSCCFEHLGSLEAGMRFVINSVEKTLKPGGIACHTTELNLSSNEETLEAGETVLYRRRDIQELIERLSDRGHTVSPLKISPARHPLDFHVDSHHTRTTRT